MILLWVVLHYLCDDCGEQSLKLIQSLLEHQGVGPVLKRLLSDVLLHHVALEGREHLFGKNLVWIAMTIHGVSVQMPVDCLVTVSKHDDGKNKGSNFDQSQVLATYCCRELSPIVDKPLDLDNIWINLVESFKHSNVIDIGKRSFPLFKVLMRFSIWLSVDGTSIVVELESHLIETVVPWAQSALFW